ncbi:MAG: hypothetical protein RLZ84_426 [Actinomycetota bacterium]
MVGGRPNVEGSRSVSDDSSKVIIETPDAGVARITLNNPKMNALSAEVLVALYDATQDSRVSTAAAVIVTGGPRLFAAGADVTEFGGQHEARLITDNFHRTADAIASLRGFVIASVSGYALGGGCEIALACDYRIASTKAVFGQPEVLLGIIPGGGGTQRLPRVVGRSRALELMVTGRQVASEEALRIGLADEVTTPEDLDERTLALAREVAAGATVAQRLIKRAVDGGINRSLADGLARQKTVASVWRVSCRTDPAKPPSLGVEQCRANSCHTTCVMSYALLSSSESQAEFMPSRSACCPLVLVGRCCRPACSHCWFLPALPNSRQSVSSRLAVQWRAR